VPPPRSEPAIDILFLVLPGTMLLGRAWKRFERATPAGRRRVLARTEPGA
jgi:hypothetical protein